MAEISQATFNFELVSPERRLMSEPANMVIVPGEEGHFGVLAGHSALVATIKPGVVEIHTNGDVRRIFIAGGFADVTPVSCTILAEEATSIADLDLAVLEKSLVTLNEDLTLAKDDMERARVIKKINLVQAKIEAVTGKIAA